MQERKTKTQQNQERSLHPSILNIGLQEEIDSITIKRDNDNKMDGEKNVENVFKEGKVDNCGKFLGELKY